MSNGHGRPNNGYSSFANHLERRIICQDFISFYRRQGRMVFRRMYENNRVPQYQTHCIGHEMVEVPRGYSRWNASGVENGAWLFRCYLDGTALYKQNKTHNTVNRYNSYKAIDDVVFKHYYKENTQGDGMSYDERKILVLRRKPVSSHARSLMSTNTSLGDYLVRKYNYGGACEETVQS